MKLLSVAGARPNFMKLAAIARAVVEFNQSRKTGHELITHVIVHTGQHYDEKMSISFFEDRAIPKPDINLEVGSGSHALQIAEIMRRLEPVLLAEQPDVLLVAGDLNSTIACTLKQVKAFGLASLLNWSTYPEKENYVQQQDSMAAAPPSGIYIVPPLGSLDFLHLVEKADLKVIIDSGGIQEETTYLKIPCMTLRHNTERPVTVTVGSNYLVGTEPDAILTTAATVIGGRMKKAAAPELWDGRAGTRILDIISQEYYSQATAWRSLS